eukprot:TRINITY_DN32215_c0_g1_i1.p1 TRINITY_DN32215_c0_g1~~TRINITY_DN32215_c0_g1_i1.p1  ORF type:complete len:420 (+),score=149.89 TRINITY_DN32215_c0_g1_i1:47-1306(+)
MADDESKAPREEGKDAAERDNKDKPTKKPPPEWDLDDDDLLPEPPEHSRKKDFEEYRTGIEEVREGIIKARQEEQEYNKHMERVGDLEKRLEEEKEKETDVEKLQKRVLELERDLAEATQEDNIVDTDRFWKRRNRNLQQLRDELKVEIELEKLRGDRMAREVYMGESLDTKMAIRLKAIELDNQRLRRQLQVLLDQEHEHLKVKPINEYLFSLAKMLNEHEKEMKIMQKEVEALEVTYNYYEENDKEDKENKIKDLYCGRCRMKIVEEQRGGEQPKMMSVRPGPVYGEPYYKGQGAVLGYDPPPARPVSPPRGQFLLPTGGTTYGHYPGVSKDLRPTTETERLQQFPTPHSHLQTPASQLTPAQQMRAEAAGRGAAPARQPAQHSAPRSRPNVAVPQSRYKPPAPKLVYTERGTWEPV